MTLSKSKPGNAPTLLEANPDTNGVQRQALEGLIKKFAPVLCFHPGEECLPVAVDWYLQKVWMTICSTKQQMPVTVSGLQEASASGDRYCFELKEGGSFFQAEKPMKTYVHAKSHNTVYTDLQYWFLFAYTGSASAVVKWFIDGTIKGYEGKVSLNPLGRFNGCWERIAVRVNNLTQEAEQVFFSQGDTGAWVPAEKLQRRGSQVMAYVSKGSYLFYPDGRFGKEETASFNLYSSRLDFNIQHEVGSGKEIDFSGCCELISTDSAGEAKTEEPLWLNFSHHWGNPAPEHLTVSGIKRVIHSSIGKDLGFLLSRDLLDELAFYVLNYFSKNYHERSMAPKSRKCWAGEETD